MKRSILGVFLSRPHQFDSRRWPYIIFSSVVILAVTASLLQGATVRVVNLVEMIALADRIFVGQCVSREQKTLESGRFQIVEYVIRAEHGIKGVNTGQEVVVRQFGPIDSQVIPGIPSYQKGKKMLIFLYGDSRLGLTSPVGLGQGIFYLEKSAEGDVGVVNSLKNRNLIYGLDGQLSLETNLSSEDLKELRQDLIPIDRFINILERLSSRN